MSWNYTVIPDIIVCTDVCTAVTHLQEKFHHNSKYIQHTKNKIKYSHLSTNQALHKLNYFKSTTVNMK